MSSKWIVMRHAHSLGNENYKLAQTVPESLIDLSELGNTQAVAVTPVLLDYISSIEPKVSFIRFYCSPYNRAVQTMAHLRAGLQSEFNISHKIIAGLHEKGLGRFEGYDLAEIESHFGEEATCFLREYNDPLTKRSAKPPHRSMANGDAHDHIGESYDDAIKRAASFVEDHFTEDAGSDTINIVVGHGRSNTFIEKAILRLPDEDYLSILIPHNVGFKVFENLPNGNWAGCFQYLGISNPNERSMEKLASPSRALLQKLQAQIAKLKA